MKRIIIVPGLGDQSTLERLQFVINRWQKDGTQVDVFESKWSEDEPSFEKIARLETLYNQEPNADTYLVGYSAGGALANVLFGKYPDIKRAVLISSKLKGSDTIGETFQKRAPALLDTVRESEKTITNLSETAKRKLICLVPIFDEVVPKKDMKIENVKTKTIPAGLHAVAIAFALIFMTRGLLKD